MKRSEEKRRQEKRGEDKRSRNDEEEASELDARKAQRRNERLMPEGARIHSLARQVESPCTCQSTTASALTSPLFSLPPVSLPCSLRPRTDALFHDRTRPNQAQPGRTQPGHPDKHRLCCAMSCCVVAAPRRRFFSLQSPACGRFLTCLTVSIPRPSLASQCRRPERPFPYDSARHAPLPALPSPPGTRGWLR